VAKFHLPRDLAHQPCRCSILALAAAMFTLALTRALWCHITIRRQLAWPVNVMDYCGGDIQDVHITSNSSTWPP